MDKSTLKAQIELSHAYHRPEFQETMDAMGVLRDAFWVTANEVVERCPVSREMSLALTHLDEANMWAIAALARHEPKGVAANITSHPKGVT